jgi:hypothetical protein
LGTTPVAVAKGLWQHLRWLFVHNHDNNRACFSPDLLADPDIAKSTPHSFGEWWLA